MAHNLRVNYEKIPKEVVANSALLRFETYEEYLNTFLRPKDLEYALMGPALALVQVGCGGRRTAVSEKELNRRVKEVKNYFMPRRFNAIPASLNMTVFPDSFLLQLALREQSNLDGDILTIIYIRYKNRNGHEVSAYIDFRSRLRRDNWHKIFKGTKKLTAKKTDLCYMNWRNQQVMANHTENFTVKSHDEKGLVFICDHDQKMICLDDRDEVCTTRTELKSNLFLQTVVYDHTVMKRTNLTKF